MWAVIKRRIRLSESNGLGPIKEHLKAPPEFSASKWRAEAMMDSGAEGDVGARF